MRVIAGSAKGVRLGPVPPGVRPMADRAREGLFSSLGEAVTGAAVLDLFAGTGALGIEALSRGAASAHFVDRARASIQAVADNLRRAWLEDRATTEAGDALRVLSRDRGPQPRYDLVLADPPYENDVEEVQAVLRALSDGWLREPWSVVLTRATRNSTLVIPVHWLVSKRLEYGDTAVLILRPEPGPGSPPEQLPDSQPERRPAQQLEQQPKQQEA